MRALKATGLTGRGIFLDAKKTRRELQPARVTHRVHEGFSDLVANQGGDRDKVTKNLAKKSVAYDGVEMGQTLGGTWKWLPAASRWPQEELGFITSWAVGEAG